MTLKNNDPRYAPHYQMALRVKPHIGKAIEELAKEMGLTKTAVIVTAVRELAERRGVQFQDTDDQSAIGTR